MKKLLLVVLAFVGITCGAIAEPKEYKSGDFVCARVDEIIDRSSPDYDHPRYFQGAPYSFARIYFDTASSEAHTGCEDYYKEISQDLAKNIESVARIVMIGMADKQGTSNSYDNRGLAQKRADYVHMLFYENGWSEQGAGFAEKYVSGSSDAEPFENMNNPEHRSVDIYVIWFLPTCDNEVMQNIATLQNDLKNYDGPEKAALDDAFKELSKICANEGDLLTGEWAEEYAYYLSQLAVQINKIRKEHPEVQINVPAAEGISVDAAYARLKETRSKLGLTTSVWRNAEGKFNTARLASDSIAGVVLGTAGGLITSHLVKKNQVKKGFEDIQCTIGGQKVAEWGDEFTVGIR
ncbi:MAG: hypothetical protein J6Y49_00305 [Alphaproteobacteria bacterium]|nr:hypothetical protein [Alphaproteobacteria bacterium]